MLLYFKEGGSRECFFIKDVIITVKGSILIVLVCALILIITL